ncbi:MAG: hypothetical protein HUU35_10505 [Armatimonadetes bacterium]|nr:hypothetical protein [Armatimonadota bacterium]
MLRKRPFRVRHVAVTAAVSEKLPIYRLRFSSQPRGEFCGFSLDDDSVSLEWSEPSGAGEWSKRLQEPRPRGADAWFVVEQPGGVPLTSNADFACYLQVTEQRGPTEANGAPSLLGWVVICFNDPDQSWIAGTFAADGCR